MKEAAPISVIIPTYNRAASLRTTLDSLAGQSLSPDCFEVIVVDDGSEDNTPAAAAEPYPFNVRYVRQANQGDAAARNSGAAASAARLLIFMDDDIIAGRDYVAALAAEHERGPKRIVVGTAHLWLEPGDPLSNGRPSQPAEELPAAPVAFADVCSNNMAIGREAYLALGGMEALGFRGSSMWCDVDFTYRALQHGFEFIRSPQAVCWHRDYVAHSLENQKRRTAEAAYRAVALFQKHPALLPHIPMFQDKTPIAWKGDRPRLIARKLGRQLASSRPALASLEAASGALARVGGSGSLRRPIERWIVGGYAYRGFRRGLRELEPVRRG